MTEQEREARRIRRENEVLAYIEKRVVERIGFENLDVALAALDEAVKSSARKPNGPRLLETAKAAVRKYTAMKTRLAAPAQ